MKRFTIQNFIILFKLNWPGHHAGAFAPLVAPAFPREQAGHITRAQPFRFGDARCESFKSY